MRGGVKAPERRVIVELRAEVEALQKQLDQTRGAENRLIGRVYELEAAEKRNRTDAAEGQRAYTQLERDYARIQGQLEVYREIYRPPPDPNPEIHMEPKSYEFRPAGTWRARGFDPTGMCLAMCLACDGSGRVKGPDRSWPCPACGGSGRRP